MSSDKPSILITGANGFVGARLCRTFLAKGFKVIAGVRQTADLNQLQNLDVTYCYGDVLKPEALVTMVEDVDFIIHNAGIVKAKNPDMFFEVNEKGTKNIYDAVQKNNTGVKKTVYISSAAASGPSDGNRPRTEADEPEPLTIYGRSKLAGERVALSYADRFHSIAVRPPGIYGPGDREILAFFQTVNYRLRPCLGNMNRLLQLVHVDDLCRGLALAVEGRTETGEAYFVAEDRSYKMKELVRLLEKAVGKKGIPAVVPAPLFRLIAATSETVMKVFNATPMLTREKANELLANWEVSTDKAREHFGYKSEICFEDGARDTFEWYKREGWL